MSPEIKRFRILSLDGGGTKGAFTAAVLAEWEKSTGRVIVDLRFIKLQMRRNFQTAPGHAPKPVPRRMPLMMARHKYRKLIRQK